MGSTIPSEVCFCVLVTVAEHAREQLITGAPYPLKIDLRFGNAGRQLSLLLACALPGNLPRQSLNLRGQRRIGRYGRPQTVAQRVTRRTGLAGERTWPCASACIRSIGEKFSATDHATF